jgi:hypothetical protein
VKGLIIDEPWIGYIICGTKTWEMRSRNTVIRGRIALIRKGSKAVIGVAELVETLPKLSVSDLKASFEKHRVPESDIGENTALLGCFSARGHSVNRSRTATLPELLSG